MGCVMMGGGQPRERVFLGWDGPASRNVARWLAVGAAGQAPRFSDTLVVVPTAGAVLAVRDRLLGEAGGRDAADGGVFLPDVVTPRQFIEGLVPDGPSPVASPVVCWMLMADVLGGLATGGLDALLPATAASGGRRDPVVRQQVARRICDLRSALAEVGDDIAGVLGRQGADLPGVERERWEDLARVEDAYRRRMRSAGLRDPDDAKVVAATGGDDPAPPCQRLVLACLCDPLRLALLAAARLARGGVDVHVLVDAPPDQADAFDAWGIPRVEAWRDRGLDDGFVREHVHVVHGAHEECGVVVRAVRDGGERDGPPALGVAAADRVPRLRHALGRAGLAAYDPGGHRVSATPLFQAVRDLVALSESGAFTDVQRVLRRPLVQDWLGRRRLLADASELLRQLDRLAEDHLPVTRDAAARILAEAEGSASSDAGLSRILDALGAATDRRGRDACEHLRSLLLLLCGERPLDPTERQVVEVFGEVLASAGESPAEAVSNPDLLVGQLLAFAGERMVYPPREAAAVPLVGWLELPWVDAPWLVIAGCVEGSLPDVVAGDAFLPESLRARLGLPTNASRLARDLFLTHGLIARRRTGGRVDMLVARHAADGTPCAPSRLFLHGAGKDLPGRIRRLFADRAPAPRGGTRRPSWPLDPAAPTDGIRIPESLSVTGFGSYLSCPFRFYLNSVLRMRPARAEAPDMDARLFGELCHEALRAWSESASRDCPDERAVEAFLVGQGQAIARRWFGADLSVPVRIQIDIACRRLAAVGRLLAREAATGWRVVHGEWAFGHGDNPFDIDGMPVRGRIDLIQRHGDGQYRVLDFKTKDKPDPPDKAHWKGVRGARDDVPAYALTADGKKRWTNLQLPLYVHAVGRLLPGCDMANTQAGYVHVAHAVEDTAVAVWEGLPDQLGSAADCARGVVADIRRGRFWPPGQVAARMDDFADVLFDGPDPGVLSGGLTGGPDE